MRKVILKSFFALMALVCIIASLPVCQNMAINVAEDYLGRSLRNVLRWKEIWSHCAILSLFLVSCLSFLLFTKIGNNIILQMTSSNKKFFSACKNSGKPLSFLLPFLFLFFFFCFFKIIDSNFIYADDVFRRTSGNRSWIGFGRYFSEFASIFFHNAIEIEDVAPLIQFISLAVMVLTSIVICYVVLEKVRIFPVILSSLVFISPYFAECISYRYDSLYMTLSIFFSAIPFLYRKDTQVFVFTSFIGLLLALMSYQSGTSVYILLTIFWVYNEIQQKNNVKDILPSMRFALLAAAVFAFVLLFYYFAFANKVSMSSGGAFQVGFGLSSVFNNYMLYFAKVFNYYGGKWTKFFLLLIFAINLIVCIKQSEQKKIVSVILTFAAVVIALLFSYGPYIIFPSPPFTWRSFMGFSFFCGLLALNVYRLSSRRILQIPSAMLVYTCIVFLFAYGNGLSDQKKYSSFRSEILLNDLSKFTSADSICDIYIDGSIGYSKALAVAIKNYPIIDTMIPVIPRYMDSGWNSDMFSQYNFYSREEEIPQNHGYPLLVSTRYHDIFGQNNSFYIILKK